MLGSLPDTPLEQQTLMGLGNQTDEITTVLPVAGYETDGSILSDLIFAFYLSTGDRRALLGFDGSGWQPIEKVPHSETFTTDADELLAWFDNQATYEWLAANGGDLNTSIALYETNKSDAPHFIRPSTETTE